MVTVVDFVGSLSVSLYTNRSLKSGGTLAAMQNTCTDIASELPIPVYWGKYYWSCGFLRPQNRTIP